MEIAGTNLPAPMNWSNEQDHHNMMEQLGIKTLRRGAEGMNTNAPNWQNTDEAKANPFPNLPDPLVMKNGQKVATPEMWWDKRRPEIVEDFDREVYGRVPANVPKVNWEVTKTTHETNGGVPVITKQLVGHVDNSSYPAITVDIQLTLTTPANAAGPVPVMMDFGFGGFGAFGGRRGGGTNGAVRGNESLWRDESVWRDEWFWWNERVCPQWIWWRIWRRWRADVAAAAFGQKLGICGHRAHKLSGG